MRAPVGIVGFTGYSGAEAVGFSAPSATANRCCWSIAPIPATTASCCAKPPIRRAPATPDPLHAEGLKAVLLATPPEVSMDLAPKFLRRRRDCNRPQRGFPAAHSRALQALVQGRAHRARPSRRSRLRAAGILPRTHSRSAADFESRLLSDGGESGHPASGCSGHRRSQRRHCLRCEERRQRRGPESHRSRPASAK